MAMTPGRQRLSDRLAAAVRKHRRPTREFNPLTPMRKKLDKDFGMTRRD